MIKYLSVSGCMLIIISSCYTPRYVYSPAAHNVPLLTKKGDSKIALNYSSNLSFNKEPTSNLKNSYGYDIQGAYAVSKHVALQSSYYSRHEKNDGSYSNNRDSSVIRYHRYLFEFGAGYFHHLDTGSHFTFQVFTGIGFGKFTFTDNGKNPGGVLYSHFHQADITKVYLQPALVLKTNRQITVSISSRFSIINFHTIKTDYTTAELTNYQLNSLDYSPVFFWEPSFINSFGFKKIPGLNLEYQFGMSLLMSRKFVDGRSFNFSAGIILDIPMLLKKKRVAPKN